MSPCEAGAGEFAPRDPAIPATTFRRAAATRPAGRPGQGGEPKA